MAVYVQGGPQGLSMLCERSCERLHNDLLIINQIFILFWLCTEGPWALAFASACRRNGVFFFGPGAGLAYSSANRSSSARVRARRATMHACSYCCLPRSNSERTADALTASAGISTTRAVFSNMYTPQSQPFGAESSKNLTACWASVCVCVCARAHARARVRARARARASTR